VDDSENEVKADTLAYDRGPETAVAAIVGEINVAAGIEGVEPFSAKETLGQHAGVGLSEDLRVRKHGFDLPVAAPMRGGAAAKVDVGGVRALGILKKLVDVGDLDAVVEVFGGGVRIHRRRGGRRVLSGVGFCSRTGGETSRKRRNWKR